MLHNFFIDREHQRNIIVEPIKDTTLGLGFAPSFKSAKAVDPQLSAAKGLVIILIISNPSSGRCYDRIDYIAVLTITQ